MLVEGQFEIAREQIAERFRDGALNPLIARRESNDADSFRAQLGDLVHRP